MVICSSIYPKYQEFWSLNKINFLNLSANKIKNIHNTINSSGKIKLRINITTKELSRKQIIISMSNNNKLKFITLSNSHIANLNRALKNIKSDIIADFVWSDQYGLIITTNKVTSLIDLHTIENYVKNSNNINSDDISTTWLPQSKFYF